MCIYKLGTLRFGGKGDSQHESEPAQSAEVA